MLILQLRETEAMDSSPLTCLPRGSIVTVLKSTVSDNYDILSRRVLVKHVSEAKGESTEGWASVQSSQGYVILSPLVSLCYENTRWGNTRPIVRQCGHAAHLKCVETHTLSLHQRAAGEQPYDGRFAANIDDGEFLCPLCKQLSNILIPRDGCARSRDTAEAPPGEVSEPVQQPRDAEQSLRLLLTKGTVLTKEHLENLNEIGQKALTDFGAHLLQAMDVPWERTTGARKRKHRRWHPAIQRWDYEEEDDDLTSPNSSQSVKSVLRLLRQQHIAWASVGHSAATAEASTRGIEEVLPFGAFSKTEDPWSGYEDSKDTHPMLSELKRTLTGASGLSEVLIFEMARQLSSGDSIFVDKEVSVIGKCLADILGGRSWMLPIPANKKEEASSQAKDALVLWSQLTALMTSMPCHVARDGMISQRHEARAAAAAMWTVRGLGTQFKGSGEPPVPLAFEEIYASTSPRPAEVPSKWGTMSPSVPPTKVEDSETEAPPVPFRPAVASAFLYTPLLAWDLNTLAGAVFSSMLLNEVKDLPTSDDLLHVARLLIMGRLIQAMITPHGYDSPDNMDMGEEDEEGRWAPGEMDKEGQALSKLVAHCRAMIQSKSLNVDSALMEGEEASSPANLFGSLGRAILPFSRSIILMLRACSAAVKQRQRRSRSDSEKLSDADRSLESLLEGSESMTTSDGFFVMKEMKGPLPTALVDDAGTFLALINRWLTAVVVLERHHGSRGQSLIPEIVGTGAVAENAEQKTISKGIPHSGGVNDSTTSAPSSQSQQPEAAVRLAPARHRRGAAAEESEENSDDENMDVDDPSRNGRARILRFIGDNQASEEDLDDSDEDLIEEMEMDEAEEMVGFADQVLGTTAFGAGRHASNANDAEDSADEPSTSGSDGEGDGNDSAYIFSNVSQSPIVSHQPSLLALGKIGPGRQESMFEAGSASAVMADLSHLGLIHRKGKVFLLCVDGTFTCHGLTLPTFVSQIRPRSA
jgi:hypothetical protein